MNKFGHVHIWYICPPPPKNFFLFFHFFFRPRKQFFLFFCTFFVSRFRNFGDFFENVPSWNGRNNSISPVEKRRAFGFYRNNNSGYNRCELLTLEIYFLESVWSSIGNETWARSGIAIVVPMKISEGARSFSRQHKTSNCFFHSSRRLTSFLHKKYHQNITETVFMLRNKKVC